MGRGGELAEGGDVANGSFKGPPRQLNLSPQPPKDVPLPATLQRLRISIVGVFTLDKHSHDIGGGVVLVSLRRKKDMGKLRSYEAGVGFAPPSLGGDG